MSNHNLSFVYRFIETVLSRRKDYRHPAKLVIILGARQAVVQ